MTDQQFIIDVGNDQRAVVEPDDAAWLQDKLRKEPGSTRLELRYDESDAEGHGWQPRVIVVAEGDDDTEGHAIALNFPTREEADAFRKRLMLTGVLAGTLVLGAAGGVGLANMSNEAATLGAASTAVSGSDWSQVERPAAAEAGTAGSAWTVDERPDYAALGAAGAASSTDGSSVTDRPDYAALSAAGATGSTDESAVTDRPDYAALSAAGAATSTDTGSAWTSDERPGAAAAAAGDEGSSSTDDGANGPSIGGPTPR